jgi:acyl carrier protein
MAVTKAEIDGAVTEALVGALGVEEDEVTKDATVLGDLGAESIDLLDILFRLERKLGVKIQAADLAAHVQGGIPDDEFSDTSGKISAKGLAQLKKVMPQIDTDALAGKLEAEKVMSLFSVDNLSDLVASKLAAKGA